MKKKIQILFIVPSMNGGGAEKVISTLLQYMNADLFQISLVLLVKEGVFLKDIPSHVSLIDLNVKRVRYALGKIIKVIIKTKPDIVFSTLGHLNLAISMLIPLLKIRMKKKIIYIARESNTVSVINQQEKYTIIMNLLYKYYYSHFDYIIAQAEYMKNDLIENYNLDKNKIQVIYNPVDIEKINVLANKVRTNVFASNKINLLAVGRLSYQKGFDILLKALIYLDERFFLTILGTGNEYENLKEQIIFANLEHKVCLKGFEDNPYPYMKQADILILSSRFEGFPNVVLESNACNTPVIAFNCPGGIEEIIISSENGWLVECGNYKELAKTLNTIEFSRQYDIENIKRFDIHYIIQQYEEFFIKILE